MEPRHKQDLYRIGTVASLTGISVERLRAWERRYDLSPAHKSGRTRFYSKSQLDRLKLIKHLIDQGQPISSLAPLNTEQLKGRIEQEQGSPVVVAAHSPKVGLVGPNLLMLEQQARKGGHLSRLEVVSRWSNMESFSTDQTGTDDPQVLILQLPVLDTEAVSLARELLPEAKIVLVYQFATAKTISTLESNGFTTLKWPVSWNEIEHITIAEMGLPARADRPVPRRFSDDELIAIAATSEDPTNCPQYLIEAIQQLNAFAGYVEDCRHAVPRPAVYGRLQTDASQARAQLEAALDNLLEELDD